MGLSICLCNSYFTFISIFLQAFQRKCALFPFVSLCNVVVLFPITLILQSFYSLLSLFLSYCNLPSYSAVHLDSHDIVNEFVNFSTISYQESNSEQALWPTVGRQERPWERKKTKFFDLLPCNSSVFVLPQKSCGEIIPMPESASWRLNRWPKGLSGLRARDCFYTEL